MHLLLPIIASIIFILIFGLIQLLFFRFLNREWWDKKWIRKAAWFLPLAGILSVLLWGFGEYYAYDWLAVLGVIPAFIIFISEVCLIISLPVSGVIHFVSFLTDKLSSSHKKVIPKIDRQRRLILKSTAAAVPLLALATGASGVVNALTEVKVYKRIIKIKNLPLELNGLKILHLSDLHLRHYLTLDNVADLLLRAQQFSPDITLVTGDIADDLTLLPDAIKLIEEMNSPLGQFASLGNHEYYRGVEQAKRHFQASNSPLFVDDGTTIKYNNYPIFIGGLDDPRSMGAKDNNFYKVAIDKTLAQSSADAFSILMSHRPDALDYASDTGVNLILAGHTHGGQIGFNGRSLFEKQWPDSYLWGEYRLKNSYLYTSAGTGHWFPFRLGCPAEAPVLVLRQA